MTVEQISTNRLYLVPFTHKIATCILEENYDELTNKGIVLGEGWPDEDAIETLPKIIKNLDLVESPTGFESWMIIKKDRMMIIGDTGFKGRPNSMGEVDIGYAIIEKERKNGYGIEAAKGLASWAFSRPEVKVITAKCLLNNKDSARILEKMGFKEITRDDEMISWSIGKQSFQNND
jgi:ribosomal-protein-alanine N-acetyltransferase